MGVIFILFCISVVIARTIGIERNYRSGNRFSGNVGRGDRSACVCQTGPLGLCEAKSYEVASPCTLRFIIL